MNSCPIFTVSSFTALLLLNTKTTLYDSYKCFLLKFYALHISSGGLTYWVLLLGIWWVANVFDGSPTYYIMAPTSHWVLLTYLGHLLGIWWVANILHHGADLLLSDVVLFGAPTWYLVGRQRITSRRRPLGRSYLVFDGSPTYYIVAPTSYWVLLTYWTLLVGIWWVANVLHHGADLSLSVVDLLGAPTWY